MRVTPCVCWIWEAKLEKALPDHHSCLAERLHYHSAKDQLGDERDSTWREGDRAGLPLVV